MRAMVLNGPAKALELQDLPVPAPAAGEVLIAVEACGVCRTDLHLLDGELDGAVYPVVPGHQIVGTVVSDGGAIAAGTRVGVPWVGRTCGGCGYCLAGRENLCDAAQFTGFDLPGGYAQYVTADARFCLPLDPQSAAVDLAPLLCAGAIGYRALKMCGDSTTVGLYGFGAAAHIVAQLLRHQGRRFYAFTRPGDDAAQASARSLRAEWAGGSDERAPQELDAAIIFAPVGALVPTALSAVRKGGTVVCGGIHMSDIPGFPYSLLWGERELRSVANLTRTDAAELLALAAEIPIDTRVTVYPLERANDALAALRAGRMTGSAVLALG